MSAEGVSLERVAHSYHNHIKISVLSDTFSLFISFVVSFWAFFLSCNNRHEVTCARTGNSSLERVIHSPRVHDMSSVSFKMVAGRIAFDGNSLGVIYSLSPLFYSHQNQDSYTLSLYGGTANMSILSINYGLGMR